VARYRLLHAYLEVGAMGATIERLRKICADPIAFDFTDDNPTFVLELVKHLNATLAQRGSNYRFLVTPSRRSGKI
jgi:hypothetical protein